MQGLSYKKTILYGGLLNTTSKFLRYAGLDEAQKNMGKNNGNVDQGLKRHCSALSVTCLMSALTIQPSFGALRSDKNKILSYS